MARQEKLTEWILRNDERLDLRVQELSWIKDVFPGWHDLQVSISVFGKRFVGRGSDRDSNVALGKAVCEAVERSVCFRHRISSLGVAGHLSAELAGENARIEWIERASFGQQITNGTRLEPLAGVAPEISSRYRNRGVEIGFFRIASPESCSVVLCLADGAGSAPSFGGILGLGASSDKSAATQKALFECLRSLEFFLYAKPAALTEAEFRKIERPAAQDRQALLRDPAYFRSLLSNLCSPPHAVKLPDGTLQPLVPDAVFGDCPLVFMRYTAETEIHQPEFLA